uniref:Uncharacterized protein n=1 Tax=Oryza rufipogon TaxID=4529 RepID=A0A0E0NKD5_ORYRU
MNSHVSCNSKSHPLRLTTSSATGADKDVNRDNAMRVRIYWFDQCVGRKRQRKWGGPWLNLRLSFPSTLLAFFRDGHTLMCEGSS